jgi:hypothetical protein
LNDLKREANLLWSTFGRVDGVRRFDIVVNGPRLAEMVSLTDEIREFYARDSATNLCLSS